MARQRNRNKLTNLRARQASPGGAAHGDSNPVSMPSPREQAAQLFQLPKRHAASQAANETAIRQPNTAELAQGRSHKQADDARQGKSKESLWYALYFPQLAELTDNQQGAALDKLAAQAEQVSSPVSLHPQALVCEIRSSLSYFGGMEAIHDKLAPLLAQTLSELTLPTGFCYAACPTVSGSLLLARGGFNRLVYRRDNLRSALGELPYEVLHLGGEQNRRLYNMGVRHLRDIWRLPSEGLRKRFGSELVNLLNKAVGKAPEPTRNYVPPPKFSQSYDLPFELENLDRLMPVVDEMLTQLCDFLRRRDLSTSQIELALIHERRSRTELSLGLRQATRNTAHLSQLIETHFTSLELPAPVIGLRLDVNQFDAFTTHNEALLLEGKSSGQQQRSRLNEFMEKLQARLGHDRLQSIHSIAEHCPEYACSQQRISISAEPGHRLNSHRKDASADAATLPAAPRPLWLLDEPEELVLRHGRLYHRRPITLVSGPERIESHWWSGTDVRRDYYVAQEDNGSRLWVYHEKRRPQRWYLHGYFS